MRIFIGVCLVSLLLTSINTFEDKDYEIVQINEYCRHGARTTFKDQIHQDITSQYGVGILTPNGYRMHYLLGEQLKANYPSVFSEDFKLSDMSVLVSPVIRCQLSALSQIEGILGFGKGPSVSESSDAKSKEPPFENLTVEQPKTSDALPHLFQPIPFKTEGNYDDRVFLSNWTQTCPKNYELFQKVIDSVNNLNPLMNGLDAELKANGVDPMKLYGDKNWTMKRISSFGDEVVAYENYHGKDFPGITGKLKVKFMLTFYTSFLGIFDHPDIADVMADKPARFILEGMTDFVEGKKKKKFRLLSGHDTGLIAHLFKLKMTSVNCYKMKMQGKAWPEGCAEIPQFAANFIYELQKRKSDSKYFVKVRYNSNVIEFCPGQTLCPFDTFKKIFEKTLFVDKEKFENLCTYKFDKRHRKIEEDEFLIPFWGHLIVCGSILLFFLIVLGVLGFKIFVLSRKSDGFYRDGVSEDASYSLSYKESEDSIIT